ncbi:MAG: efflux RND transporter periplasmic adaptor subunit [Candidatus Marinimicrobia bacterium]|jgi:HlyD family secretion protein|nr:efflux RND transporter periplasmic adaptor subunit [Candidatus Neomarinimicrobiota bacterium]
MLNILKKKKVWIPLLTLFIITSGYFVSGSGDEKELRVEVELIQSRDIVHKVNASGKIQPEEAVQITSTITGWITQITVMEGDTVEPGQHLISIDEKQIRPRYNNALSQVKSSEANLRKVQSQMDRTKSLFSQSLISKQELEQVEASYQIALSQSEQANANLLSAEDELSKTRLTAPKYGIVTSITKEEGEMAVGGMFNPGVLMTVADLSRMEVEVDVNENDVVNIEIGDTSEIEIDAYPDTIFYGVVSEIAHTAKSSNMGVQNQVTNFKVKVRMVSVPDKIRPGMSSTVNIITETLAGVISIPIQSLTSRPENYAEKINNKKSENKWKNKDDEERVFSKVKPIDVVFILENEFGEEKAPDDKKFAIVRPVDVGVSSENHYSVNSGLKLGEMIVIGGYRVLSKELYHGALVSVNDNSIDKTE